MHSYLKQATASQSRSIGPFLDDTDFKTAETALTIANTDIKLIVNGAASANKNSGGGTHRVNGVYGVTFDATDTATVGEVLVSVVVAGALPVFATFVVLEETIYDALFAASSNAFTGAAGSSVARADVINIAGAAVSTTTAQLGVNVVQISADSTAADNLETAFDDTAGAVPWQGIIDQGTAQSATGTTLVLRSAAAFTDDQLIGATIHITGGSTGVGERRLITDYVQSTDTATVDAWNTTPTGTITYKIFATAPSSGGGSGLDAAGVRAAVGLASANLDTQLADIPTVAEMNARTLVSAGYASPTNITAGTITTVTNLTNAPTNGDLTATMKTSVGTAVTTATSGLATGANLATVAGYLDTEIAAILADTNELQTDWANGGRLDVILDARASQSSVDTLAGYVDTEVSAIKSQTDKLTFNASNSVAANITHVIDDPVQESGNNSTEWGGAP